MTTDLFNSLPDLNHLLMSTAGMESAAPSNRLDQIFFNNRYMLLSNFRQSISSLYMTNGLVQKFIDIPVDDAFRHGVKVKSKQLGEENIRKLLQYCDEKDILNTIATGKKWGRLYGGAGIIIEDNNKSDKPFNINEVNQDTDLNFIHADLWELSKHDENLPDEWHIDNIQVPYNYYGHPLHKSRVLKIKGKEPTSWDRPRLRNWGMSELERIMPELNSHMRAIDLIFELLHQYKIDVWKIQGFNDNLANDEGTIAVQKRIQYANQVKDYLHAVVMDKEDDFIQKQCHFSGLSDILNEIRKGLACVLNIPMTKLFGISSAGFNAGDDDLENYNTMVEHEIRAKSKYIIIDVLQIICKKLFGFVPTDMEIGWQSLRMLTAEQEENVKNSKLNRVLSAFNGGLMTSQEAILSININDLVGVDLAEKDVGLSTLAIDEQLENKPKDAIIKKDEKSSKRLTEDSYFKRYKHNRGN